MKNIRHISHTLIKHIKIFVVYNYVKFVIIELVESTGLTVLVVCRPSEQFSLTIPGHASTLPEVKGLSHDSLVDLAVLG